jgi:hypothetical protein
MVRKSYERTANEGRVHAVPSQRRSNNSTTMRNTNPRATVRGKVVRPVALLSESQRQPQKQLVPARPKPEKSTNDTKDIDGGDLEQKERAEDAESTSLHIVPPRKDKASSAMSASLSEVYSILRSTQSMLQQHIRRSISRERSKSSSPSAANRSRAIQTQEENIFSVNKTPNVSVIATSQRSGIWIPNSRNASSRVVNRKASPPRDYRRKKHTNLEYAQEEYDVDGCAEDGHLDGSDEQPLLIKDDLHRAGEHDQQHHHHRQQQQQQQRYREHSPPPHSRPNQVHAAGDLLPTGVPWIPPSTSPPRSFNRVQDLHVSSSPPRANNDGLVGGRRRSREHYPSPPILVAASPPPVPVRDNRNQHLFLMQHQREEWWKYVMESRLRHEAMGYMREGQSLGQTGPF